MKIKIMPFMLVLMTILLNFSGCFSSKKESEKFEKIYSSNTSYTIFKNETVKIDIDKSLAAKNYIKLDITTDSALVGKFIYTDVSNASKVVEEDFYIEFSGKEIEFKQFLDSFRPNSIGNFNKILNAISFKNTTTESATFILKTVSISDREVPAFEKEIYIEKDNLKVGADLTMGGTLSYLEKTSWEGYTVDEVVDFNNDIIIDVNAQEVAAGSVSSSVNLINIHDAGREFQQSYYADIGGTTEEATGENNYQRRFSYTATPKGYYWPYNPVQGGDEVCNLSQIIDYELTADTIYVKVRAMDWGNGNARPEHKGDDYEEVKNGRTSKSYMENWYTIKDGMLYVDNRFIDWNEFTNMESAPKRTIEIPAAYVVHPLHNFVCYVGQNPWDLTDETYDRQGQLAGWATGGHQNSHHPEDWFAWLNDNDFGVGVFIPEAGTYVSGRDHATISATETWNRNSDKSRMVTDYLFNKKAPTSPFTSCYVGNTSYTAPVVHVAMKQHIALSYTYVVAVDYLDNFRKDFKAINEKSEITNIGLKAWD